MDRRAVGWSPVVEKEREKEGTRKVWSQTLIIARQVLLAIEV